MKEIFKTKIGLYALVLFTILLGQSINGQDIVNELPENVKETHYTYANLFMYDKSSPNHWTTGSVDWTPFSGTDIIEGEDWITISHPDYRTFGDDDTPVSILVDGDSEISSKTINNSVCTCYSTKHIIKGIITGPVSTLYCEKVIDGTPILYFLVKGAKEVIPVYYILSEEREY
jgi:hypothetical protein